MSEVETRIISLVGELLERADKTGVEVGLDSLIHGEDGIALDSLETAELSAVLEDEFGTDPFGAGLMPETIADIVAFYTTGEGQAATA